MCWQNVGQNISETLNLLSGVTDIIGTNLAASGARDGAVADRAALEFNAEQYREAADFQDRQAAEAIKEGKFYERRSRLQTQALIGTQRAAIASNNIKVNTGSAVDIQADAAMLGEMDAIIIRENAQRSARSMMRQADYFRTQAVVSEMTGQQIDPRMAMAPTVIGGSTRVADRWLQFRHGS